MKRSSEAKKHQSRAPKRATRERPLNRTARGPAKRAAGAGTGMERYWMRCPRCGMGLIETVKGMIKTERCTACKAVWAEPQDVERAWGEGTPELFKPFREG